MVEITTPFESSGIVESSCVFKLKGPIHPFSIGKRKLILFYFIEFVSNPLHVPESIEYDGFD